MKCPRDIHAAFDATESFGLISDRRDETESSETWYN